MLTYLQKLRRLGVLGMNGRNAGYVEAFNARSKYPLVNDKVKTKKLAEKEGIAVPELYGIVEIQQQVARLPSLLEGLEDFVVKPAEGAGGDGILVVKGRCRQGFRRVGGEVLPWNDLKFHVSKILSGMYSLGGRPDKAIIECRVEPDPLFERITYQGVPDLRVLVFQGVPVMAMMRLPTRESDGKANLHKGGVGVGIELASGVTGLGVQHNRVVDEHPDTGNPIQGLSLPNWQDLLHLSSRCYGLTGLGYLGVDIVLDRHQGPLVLELNARPGLSIQIANGCGLNHRLKAVEEAADRLRDTPARLSFAKERFGEATAAEVIPMPMAAE